MDGTMETTTSQTSTIRKLLDEYCKTVNFQSRETNCYLVWSSIFKNSTFAHFVLLIIGYINLRRCEYKYIRLLWQLMGKYIYPSIEILGWFVRRHLLNHFNVTIISRWWATQHCPETMAIQLGRYHSVMINLVYFPYQTNNLL
jgi:hypothetical protein